VLYICMRISACLWIFFANIRQFLSKNPAYLENDDDAVRKVHLANIALCTHTTFQSLESLNRELDVLSMAPPPSAPTPQALERDHRERAGLRNDPEYSERLDRSDLLSSANPGPILSAGGKPLRPFTLLDSRQTIKKGVFRSGHNLPTMTIDEYLEEERARGGIIEGGGEASGLSPEPDEDNVAKADEETMKAREWDEYVESNTKYVFVYPEDLCLAALLTDTRGSGNTLNRG
jgi:immunoglobulin-binding protein 1